MRFAETALRGAFVVDVEPRGDERGFFARTFCREEFEEHGIDARVVQCNVSVTAQAGSVRGLHVQAPPASEPKLVRCTRGAVHDVIVDLRRDSPTYLQHVAVELDAGSHRALYVPPLFAHGFQTLRDDVEVFYQMGEAYAPGHERGLRFDDPALGIAWPRPVTVVADKDRAWPLLADSGGHPVL